MLSSTIGLRYGSPTVRSKRYSVVMDQIIVLLALLIMLRVVTRP